MRAVDGQVASDAGRTIRMRSAHAPADNPTRSGPAVVIAVSDPMLHREKLLE
ncbi:hypothetical protein ABZ871_25100 [Streptomyces populi]